MAKRTASATVMDNDVQREVVSGPEDCRLGQLREEFDFALNQRDSSVFSRLRTNFESRMCVWPGQSQDGRKWAARENEEDVFPWPGASDARVNLVDSYIKRDTDFMMVLWKRMQTKVSATEVNDEGWANRMTWFLRWMKYEQMREAPAENELLANYILERGSGVMGVFWDRRRQMAYESVDLEDLATKLLGQVNAAAGGAGGGGGQDGAGAAGGMGQGPGGQVSPEALQVVSDFLSKVRQPGFEKEAAGVLAQLYPDVEGGAKRLEQAVEELRVSGFAKFPVESVVKNRPRVYALAPNEDVFVSPDAIDLEDGQVHWVETMREAKLREKAATNGWDEDWLEEMIASQRGQISYGQLLFNHRFQLGLGNLLQPNRGYLDTRKLFLVVHSYRRLANADGVPGIYYTVWNPNLAAATATGRRMKGKGKGEELYAQHELLNYDHGKLPFVLVRREMRSRRIDDARGYGEIASTWQNQVKNEWDSRTDRASIATLPPSYHPAGQAPDKWGPGVQVPTNRKDAYGFCEIPRYDPGSKEIEETVVRYADGYFGFLRDPEHALDAQNAKQRLADMWMTGQKEIDTQMLQLCQQFMDDEFYFRVVGSSKGRPIHATREDIQGEFDLSVGFSVENMDMGVVKEKLGLMSAVLAMDVSGSVDRNAAMNVSFEMLDPNLGERLLRSPEDASLAEVEDEKTVFVKLLAGVAQDVKPGQAYQLRLQTLMGLLKTNQTAQELMKNNPQVQEAVRDRVKQLGLQVQQQQNAVTGRGGPMFPAKQGGD